MKHVLCRPLLLLSLAFTSCGPSPEHTAALTEAKALEARNLFLQQALEKATNEARAAERSLNDHRVNALQKEAESRKERDAVKKQLDELRKAFEEYQTKFRITSRNKAPGLKIGRLDCGENQIFDEVVITSITPGELRFRHAAGLGKVPLGRLDSKLREQFAYDPAEAAAWVRSEQEKQEALEQAEEASLLAKAKATAKTSPKAKANALARQNTLARLNALYASARALQADRNCCPVHKQDQLTSWAQQASRLKQKLAALP